MVAAHPLINEVRDGKIICTSCGEWKHPDQFTVATKMKRGRHSWCRPCQTNSKSASLTSERRAQVRARRRQNYDPSKMKAARDAQRSHYRLIEKRSRLMKKYGLSWEQYSKLVEQQEGRCAVCGTECDLHVDHDHDDLAVRGLLCRSCNVGLGNFRDQPDLLKAAAEYLERTSRTKVLQA